MSPNDVEFSLVAFLFIPLKDYCKDSLYEVMKSIVYLSSLNNKESKLTNFESWNKLKILFSNEQKHQFCPKEKLNSIEKTV